MGFNSGFKGLTDFCALNCVCKITY